MGDRGLYAVWHEQLPQKRDVLGLPITHLQNLGVREMHLRVVGVLLDHVELRDEGRIGQVRQELGFSGQLRHHIRPEGIRESIVSAHSAHSTCCSMRTVDPQQPAQISKRISFHV